MRTNTWLALMTLNQITDSWQRDSIARRQAERDRARDEKFQKAADASLRGQFAMWVQTDDGKQFEKWARFAKLASRDIDDRQDAWELAWQVENEARRSEYETAMQYYVDEMIEPVDRLDVNFARRVALSLAGVCVLGFVVLGALFSFSPDGPSGFLANALVAIGLVALIGGGLGATFVWLGSIGAPGREADLEKKRREDLEHEFREIEPLSLGSEGNPSWHESWTGDDLRERSHRIERTAETAISKFPRGGQLLHLANTYSTRTDFVPGKIPDGVARLADAFRVEDSERREKLSAARLA